jgi:hypothetical protein
MADPITRKIVLDNVRARVTERVIPPGSERITYLRDTDQIIVFVNDCSYDRVDPDTGEKITRKRKAGEIIWHDRSEKAPTLVNVGSRPMRSLVIALK